MSVSNVSFGFQVEEWVQGTNKRMITVFRNSASMVIAEMQLTNEQGGGLNRIDLGHHLASLQVGINTLPQDAIKKAKDNNGPVVQHGGGRCCDSRR